MIVVVVIVFIVVVMMVVVHFVARFEVGFGADTLAQQHVDGQRAHGGLDDLHAWPGL